MADFAAVLRKTIAALRENTPEARDRIYQKARSTIEAKLQAVTPPPAPQVVERQMRLLEDAIATVEAEYAPAAPEPEPTPENEFDKVLRDLEAISGEPSSARWSVTEKKPAAPVITTIEPEKPAQEETVGRDDAAADEAAARVGSEEPPIPEEASVAVPSVDAESLAAEEPKVASEAIEPELEVPAATSAPEHQDDRSQTDETAKEASATSEESVATPPLDETFEDRPALRELRSKRAAQQKSRKVPLAAAAILLLLGGGALGAWFYRDDVARMAGYGTGGSATEEATPSDQDVAAAPAAGVANQPESDGAGTDGAAEEPVRKLTQRLLPDGTEVDEGPASGQPTVGEGTSIAASTERPAEEARQSGDDAAVAVGQKAIFYEERTIQEQASASNGNVVWTVEQESPGSDLPPEPVIYAEASIPDKRLRLKMSIRRNVDQSLPASYIAELIFLTPEDFSGGAVGSVASISLKRTEQDAGNRLLGVPAKIADGFFLVALSDNTADIEANNLLLERMEWIDIPIVYTSGRRALITLEKGVPGGSVFNQALTAWREATSG